MKFEGQSRAKIARVIWGSLVAFGLITTADARNYTITVPENGLTVDTGGLVSDSFAFTLGAASNLDINWNSSNLFLDAVLFKSGSPATLLNQSFAASGSFLASLGTGSYTLDFFGARATLGQKSNYSFSVLAVPEADTWAMLVLGGALVGYQLRRRHKLLPRQSISPA